MSISLELILGIFGSITGATSLIIQVLKYLKEKPKIEAEIINAKHYYTSRGEKKENYFLSFSITIQVRNKGDRGTTIGKSVFYFTIGQQQFQEIPANSETRIEPNALVKIMPQVTHRSSYDNLPKQEEIPFKLILYHAHGDIKLKGSSNLV